MRNKQAVLGGAAVLAVAALMKGPALARKGRIMAHKATGLTYRSGIPGAGRATADPARGMPA